jgi:Transposase
MLHVGLDLSRRRLDFHALDERGETVAVDAVAPDADGLHHLSARFGSVAVRAAIESMNGARFVHDQLELAGWEVEIADAARVKGLAPLACKTDRIDARVLAERSWRELVPAVWLPDPAVREERERARFRLHLVRHRTSLKNRVHATLLAHGLPCPVSDLFGRRGRALLERLALPEPWRGAVEASLRLIDQLDATSTPASGSCTRSAPTIPTCRCCAASPASTGCSPTRSQPRSAPSSASPAPRSWPATAVSARASTSPATATGAARSPSKGPAACAGP